MKVVLFCGGLGTRLREYSPTVPKPLVPGGDPPIVWHLMRYYAHYGHDEFVLCLGHGADLIRQYVDGQELDWRVTLVDTGVGASVGERLRSVAPLVAGDEMFLANYSDGLTDLDLTEYVDEFSTTDAVGSFVAVRASQSFHAVEVDDCGVVTDFRPACESDLRINGGFFVFRNEIFHCVGDGEDLVDAPFQRLVAERRLRAYQFDGFWACMDTYKDKLMFDELHEQRRAPWMVWKS